VTPAPKTNTMIIREPQQAMGVALMRTKAEQALIEDFARVAAQLPGNSAIGALRRNAIDAFARAGLPHRRMEAWTYTDIRTRTTEAMAAAVPGARHLDAAALASALGAELAGLDAFRLVFVDGAAHGAAFDPVSMPGCHIGSLSAAMRTAADDWVASNLAAEPTQGSIVALNAAFATDGALIRIDAGARPAKPIHLIYVSTGTEPQRVTTRTMIEVGAGAEATFIESHIGIGSAVRQTNAVSQINCGEGARVEHLKLVMEGQQAQHLGNWIVRLDGKSAYRAFHLTAGSGTVRNDVDLVFRGRHASADVSGAFLGRGRDHIDTTMVIDHAVPNCTSRELFKGVLDGQARGVFQGKVIVRPNAQKTDGKQMAQALLLSETAEFDSKPELEIYADDVVCGHGTTSTELDGDLLFYCAARGIPKPAARALLIEAFVGEAFDRIADETVREAFRALAITWLGQAQAAASSD